MVLLSKRRHPRVEISSEQSSSKNQTVWSQQSSKKDEKMAHVDHFPHPGEIDPYEVGTMGTWVV